MRRRAESRALRRWLWGAALLAGVAQGDEGLTACNQADPSTVLSKHTATADARALWLDDRRLRWPGKPADARLVLRYTPAPGEGGEPAELTLSRAIGELPADEAARHAWIGPGGEWQLDASQAGRAAAWLGGDLVLVERDGQGRERDRTRVQHAPALDRRYAAAEGLTGLGAHSSPAQTGFRVWAPTARRVQLCLYDDDVADATRVEPLVRDAATGTWSVQLPAALDGRYYTYLVDVFVPGHGHVRNRVTDPYAVSLGADSRRTYIANLDDPRLMPPGWAEAPRGRALAASTDAMIYELHVRDFSIADTTVPEAHRGKYLAFTAGSAGMRHLRALAAAGMTDVHLLPAYDFGSVPETGCVTPQATGDDPLAWQAAIAAVAERDCFNWGYDPLHYTAPEGSYSSDAAHGATRIREFRAMVQALHAAGLRVGMDVVYNHTFASGQDPRSVLDRIVPGYYHRLNARGEVERSTCCDNTATENRMMARLMIDSAVTWARDYRIDSFRFDLMGHQPREAMQRLQQAVDAATGRHVLLLGEGWNFGEVADGARFVQASQRSLPGSGIATFSDRMRDAVRGGGCCDSGTALAAQQGWANGLHHVPNGMDKTTPEQLQRAADLVRVGLGGTLGPLAFRDHTGQARTLAEVDYVGQPAGYAASPAEVVNYVENHDNLTLFDANALKLPAGTPPAERARVQLVALSTVLMAQGIAYFHAGGEILRSKSLDRNSFNSGDAFNRLDWTLADNHFGLGLPRAEDNRASWDVMRAVLADPSVAPSPRDIAWTRDAFLDLLRVRAGTRLLRLRDADEVTTRLRLLDLAGEPRGTVVGAFLDGKDLAGSEYAAVVYLINAGTQAAHVRDAEAVGREFRLHPVQAAAGAADARPREQARFAREAGEFTVPARSVVVFVAD
ncbi:alpha-1,6-glucosidase domain-containing protein [Arenimonas sp. MALMAid1274]|uniref:alpha-1,6-glucosidase domain-containing protein n=1 Tax=Arenimonas sp. MALMAid1274 TaxID=3411630 RepID=UPI003BA346BC